MLSGLAFLLPGLGDRDHWESSEGRPPLVARDMLATGRFVPPYLSGHPEPYLNKPPFFHALVAASFQIFGDESEAAARLPALLAALLVILAAAGLARDIGGRTAALGAGLFLLGSYRFHTLARSSQLETLLVAGTTLACWGLHRAWANLPRARLLAFLGGLLAAWSKGPVLALLFPLLFVAGRCLSRRSLAPFVHSVGLFVLSGVLLATATAFGPLVFDPAMRELLFERLRMSNVEHVRGPFYYLAQVPMGLLPAGLLLIPAGPHLWRERTHVGTFAWAFGLGLLVLSSSASKQSHYALPLYPFLAVGVGVSLPRVLDSQKTWICFLALVALVGGVVLGFAATHPFLASVRPLAIAGGSVLLTVAGSALWVIRSGRLSTGARALLASLVTLGALLFADILRGRALDDERSPAAAMRHVSGIVQDAPMATLERKLSVLWYLDRRDAVFLPDRVAARPWLAAHPRGYVLLTEEQRGIDHPALRELRVASRWASPSGRRRFYLLGPGTSER